MSAQWTIEGSILALKQSDGSLVVPTALEVYRAATQDRLNRIPSPASAFPHIRFSRFPLKVRIRLEANVLGFRSQMGCRLVAVGKGFEASLAGPNPPDHLIIGDNWYPLASEDLESARNAFAAADISTTGPISLRSYFRLRTSSDGPDVVEDVVETLIPRNGYGRVPIPCGFSATLYPYQEIGFAWLRTIAHEAVGCLLGDEMGLGKTVQIIALLADELSQGRGHLLVIAPSTLLENWRREINRFYPPADVLVHQGASRTGFASEFGDHDIVLTSYDTLTRDLSMFEMIQWNVVVVDEAQAIKNPHAKRTLAIKALSRRVSVAVSGTPLQNRLLDLWSVTDFAFPGLLGDMKGFAQAEDTDLDLARRTERMVSPIMLRRKVVEVANDLPNRIEIPQPLVMDAGNATAYEEIRQEVTRQYGKAGGLVALLKLRMFCAHPTLLGKAAGDPASFDKYARLVELLTEVVDVGEKVLVFAPFSEIIDLVVSDLKHRFGVYCKPLDGRTPVKLRQPTVDEFSAIQGPGVLVLNPRAAGIGLNITAANHVIHYCPEWNPATEDQASARSHRKGQTRPVTIHRLFFVNTVEEIMEGRLSQKRDLAETAVIGHQGEDWDKRDLLEALRRSPLLEGIR